MSTGLSPQSPPARAPRRLPNLLAYGLALGFGAAGLFHAAALASPTLAEPSPPWRHALFVAINLAVAAGFLVRPRWFPVAFAALTLQQLGSHGTQAWRVWHLEHRIDWASAIVLVATPTVAWLLWRDRASAGP